MAKTKKETRRGSPEAIAKRRAARALNTLFEKGRTETAMDGRTLKRKRRLMQELKEGKRGETLKAHEVLGHVTELLGMGENLTSIRALKPRLPPRPPLTEEVVNAMRETQKAYNYAPQAWRLLGVDIEAIMAGEGAAAAAESAPRRGRAKKTGGRRKKAG